jgi:tRNA 5-methylaminomethyl-2-thiouridine biosynthesis bifunctional protein
MEHNHLRQRWQTLSSGHFTIVETGFGTGLNFLCAWQLWNECAPPTAQLHFVSIEKFPLALSDLTRALRLWPQLSREADLLLAQYEGLAPGFHKLVFDQGRISLTLLIGDVSQMLPQLKRHHSRMRVDAWFLDGFTPVKNPDMWQQALFDDMAALSDKGATFATFTSAGDVRRGLEKAGFEVHKAEGYGRKREMLCGQYGISLRSVSGEQNRHVIVIGGGISGTATSHALASRGWQVQLIEQHSGLAQEASGNPVGILYPKLSINDTAQGRLALSSFLHTTRLLQRIDPNKTIHDSCGLLQLAFNARESVRLQAIAANYVSEQSHGATASLMRYIDKKEASKWAGIDLMHEALYFPTAGWVKPFDFCNLLAGQGGISSMTLSCAMRIVRAGTMWQVWDERRMLAEAPVVVIANANDANSFTQSSHVPLQAVRGQITCVEANTKSSQLKTVLCTDGYISPATEGSQWIGATFSPYETSLEIRTEDHKANFSMLRRMAPQLHQSLSNQAFTGRAAVRCATSDYLPAVGLLLDSAAITANPPRHNADTDTLPWLSGLYMNTGHGSKGLITAPLCAEILASVICGEPLPIDATLFSALDPNRFLLRKMGLKRLMDVSHTDIS